MFSIQPYFSVMHQFRNIVCCESPYH